MQSCLISKLKLVATRFYAVSLLSILAQLMNKYYHTLGEKPNISTFDGAFSVLFRNSENLNTVCLKWLTFLTQKFRELLNCMDLASAQLTISNIAGL